MEKLVALISSGKARIESVTKAKKSCTAFEKPAPRKALRGRLSKKGPALHLKELFFTHREKFQEAETELYGKKEPSNITVWTCYGDRNCIGNCVLCWLRWTMSKASWLPPAWILTHWLSSGFTATGSGSNVFSGNWSDQPGHSVTGSGQSICQNCVITRN